MPSSIERLIARMRDGNVAVLTGAGISTESGIPDYRGPRTRDKPRSPIQHRDFLRDAAVRRRYWARATIGWPRFAAAQPNDGHLALARLQAHGRLRGLITQNVDRLHRRAGSEAIELHGTLSEVRCLACGFLEPRPAVHARMRRDNPDFVADASRIAPDGDVDLDPDAIARFRPAPCARCGGPLKPEVVFFGGSVPRRRVESAYALVEHADTLLVVGSSLTVFSGFRFVRRAAQREIPVVLVNLGPTRGDPFATVRIDAPAGEILRRVVDAVCPQESGRGPSSRPTRDLPDR